MKRQESKMQEFGDWCYCPNNPGVLRRLIGFDESGAPIVEEKTVSEVNTIKEQNTSQPHEVER